MARTYRHARVLYAGGQSAQPSVERPRGRHPRRLGAAARDRTRVMRAEREPHGGRTFLISSRYLVLLVRLRDLCRESLHNTVEAIP